MTVSDLKNRYAIKLPHEIGKPLYIQDVDVKKSFIKSLFGRFVFLIFILFGIGVSILLLYGAFAYEHYSYSQFWVSRFHEEHIHSPLFNSVFEFVAGLAFFIFLAPALLVTLKAFFDVDLVVVGDKGVVTYIFWPNKKLKAHKIILWSHDMELETTYSEGYYGKRLPGFKPDYFKIEYTWHQGEKVVTSFKYDTKPKPRDSEKEIAEAVKHSFEVFRITRS